MPCLRRTVLRESEPAMRRWWGGVVASTSIGDLSVAAWREPEEELAAVSVCERLCVNA